MIPKRKIGRQGLEVFADIKVQGDRYPAHLAALVDK